MKRNLTDADIQALKSALQEEKHPCRFSQMSPEDIREAVKFYKHFNDIMAESGSVLRKTMLVLGITGLVTIIGMGLITKIKQLIG